MFGGKRADVSVGPDGRPELIHAPTPTLARLKLTLTFTDPLALSSSLALAAPLLHAPMPLSPSSSSLAADGSGNSLGGATASTGSTPTPATVTARTSGWVEVKNLSGAPSARFGMSFAQTPASPDPDLDPSKPALGQYLFLAGGFVNSGKGLDALQARTQI
jgi:hypothetical protein